MSLDLMDGKFTLVQVMAWCHQAPSHHLSHCWPCSMSPYDINHSQNEQVNTMRPRQNVRHFPDDIFKCVFFNENVWNLLNISLKFPPGVRINNIAALVQIMACRRPDDKPLSEPMVISLLTHICVTRPQRVEQTLDWFLCCWWVQFLPEIMIHFQMSPVKKQQFN